MLTSVGQLEARKVMTAVRSFHVGRKIRSSTPRKASTLERSDLKLFTYDFPKKSPASVLSERTFSGVERHSVFKRWLFR